MAVDEPTFRKGTTIRFEREPVEFSLTRKPKSAVRVESRSAISLRSMESSTFPVFRIYKSTTVVHCPTSLPSEN